MAAMSGAQTSSTRSDPRPVIYGAIDLVFAATYALLFWRVLPSRSTGVSILLWGIAVVPAAAGLATLLARPRSWVVACSACALQLLLTFILLILLVVSASFLAGVYGALGQGAAVIALLLAVLAIQLVGLVPALQLKYLLTRAGRRRFGRAA